MFYWFIRGLAAILFKIYFRVEVFGRRNVPLTGGVILAANHTSYLDPPLVAVASPRQLSFLAIEQLFRIFLFGRFILALNAVPLKQRKDDTQTLRWAVQALRQGKALTIFPEGGRSSDGQFLKPQAGIGFLAVKADVPIVPVYIQGSAQAMPVRSKMIWPKKIRVYIGQQIKAAAPETGLGHRDCYRQIAQRTMQEIRRLKDENARSLTELS